ncbi:MAG: tRNA (guanosine(37)-N1)-methyltransferase TrmD [Candidatus Kapabacteria bacterium]|nr:tRNA (guanosine(37)-N1)-methyltransferase TrmD [Candidatus Kapabacteria bacterium]
MRFDLVSAVPQLMTSFMEHSIVGRARQKGLVDVHVHNLHDYATDRFRHIDDTPYGGGAGMILQCEPVFACIEALKAEREYDEVIYLCPDGELLTQECANQISLQRNVILLAGHYKGIDQRIRDVLVTREISIGDYVLSGGELPAAVVVDCVARLIPGVISDAESLLEDSFMTGLLDAPHYTKPADFRGMVVPEVLRSGDHAKIKTWRHEQALLKTQQRRPDLLDDGASA